MTTDKSSVRILIYNDYGTEKFLNVSFPVSQRTRKRRYADRAKCCFRWRYCLSSVRPLENSWTWQIYSYIRRWVMVQYQEICRRSTPQCVLPCASIRLTHSTVILHRLTVATWPWYRFRRGTTREWTRVMFRNPTNPPRHPRWNPTTPGLQ